MQTRTIILATLVGGALAVAPPVAPAPPVYHVTALMDSTGSANAINQNGDVAGSFANAAGQTRAFVWDRLAGSPELDTLGGASSEALAINDADVIAGRSEIPSGHTHGFRLPPGGDMQDLGFPGSCMFANDSAGIGINDIGAIAGFAAACSGDPSTALAPPDGVLAYTSFNDGWASDVNNRGDYVGP